MRQTAHISLRCGLLFGQSLFESDPTQHGVVTPPAPDESRSGNTITVGDATCFCSERGERPENKHYVGSFAACDARSVVIAALADGVGGAKDGRVAAELAVRPFR
jgi:hypothetical protein